MILLTLETLRNAILAAQKEAKTLKVTRTNASRQYRVENRANGNVYLVNFFICSRTKNRFGQCTCKAGQNAQACKHLAAAAAQNAYLAANGLLDTKAVSIQ